MIERDRDQGSVDGGDGEAARHAATEQPRPAPTSATAMNAAITSHEIGLRSR